MDPRFVQSQHLLDLYPNQIGLCRTGKQLENQVKRGAIPLAQQLITDLEEVLADIPRFAEWKYYQIAQDSNLGSLIQKSQEDPNWSVYKDIFAPLVPKPFTDREKALFAVFEGVRYGAGLYQSYNFPKELFPIQESVTAIAKDLPDPTQGPVSKRLNEFLRHSSTQQMLSVRREYASADEPTTFNFRQIALLDSFLLNEIRRIMFP